MSFVNLIQRFYQQRKGIRLENKQKTCKRDTVIYLRFKVPSNLAFFERRRLVNNHAKSTPRLRSTSATSQDNRDIVNDFISASQNT